MGMGWVGSRPSPMQLQHLAKPCIKTLILNTSHVTLFFIAIIKMLTQIAIYFNFGSVDKHLILQGQFGMVVDKSIIL